MFEPNDIVIYGAEGACRITEISTQNFVGTPMEYYVLCPLHGGCAHSVLYVPVGNETLTAKMKRLLTPEEIDALIREAQEDPLAWIEESALRKRTYQAIITAGDHRGAIRMLTTFYRRSEELRARGKKLSAGDERVLRDAEKMLYHEFVHVLHIEQEDVAPLLCKTSAEAPKSEN